MTEKLFTAEQLAEIQRLIEESVAPLVRQIEILAERLGEDSEAWRR